MPSPKELRLLYKETKQNLAEIERQIQTHPEEIRGFFPDGLADSDLADLPSRVVYLKEINGSISHINWHGFEYRLQNTVATFYTRLREGQCLTCFNHTYPSSWDCGVQESGWDAEPLYPPRWYDSYDVTYPKAFNALASHNLGFYKKVAILLWWDQDCG